MAPIEWTVRLRIQVGFRCASPADSGQQIRCSMLHEILTTYRDEIIARSRAKVATRTAPQPTHAELEHGVPLFLDQLVATLRRGEAAPGQSINTDIEDSASRHGEELRR